MGICSVLETKERIIFSNKILGDSEKRTNIFFLNIKVYIVYNLIVILSSILKQLMKNPHGVLVPTVVSGFDSDKYFRFEFLLEVPSKLPITICSESYYFKDSVLEFLSNGD